MLQSARDSGHEPCGECSGAEPCGSGGAAPCGERSGDLRCAGRAERRLAMRGEQWSGAVRRAERRFATCGARGPAVNTGGVHCLGAGTVPLKNLLDAKVIAHSDSASELPSDLSLTPCASDHALFPCHKNRQKIIASDRISRS